MTACTQLMEVCKVEYNCCSLPRDFEKHYKLDKEIGKGAWATVQLATELKTGEKYVLTGLMHLTMPFAIHLRISTNLLQAGCQSP